MTGWFVEEGFRKDTRPNLSEFADLLLIVLVRFFHKPLSKFRCFLQK